MVGSSKQPIRRWRREKATLEIEKAILEIPKATSKIEKGPAKQEKGRLEREKAPSAGKKGPLKIEKGESFQKWQKVKPETSLYMLSLSIGFVVLTAYILPDR